MSTTAESCLDTNSSGSSSPSRVIQVRQNSSPDQGFESPTRENRKLSITDINEKIVAMLDEIERRIETLRETASLLEDEKCKLQEMLDSVLKNYGEVKASREDKADILATATRLVERCRTVNVQVLTLRNESQKRALQIVNLHIADCIKRMQANDLRQAAAKCDGFLNACSPEMPRGAIDSKFQSAVIECTADDQKKIRRRLQQLKPHIQRAEETERVAYF